MDPRRCVHEWHVPSARSGIVPYMPVTVRKAIVGCTPIGRGFFWRLGVGFCSKSNQTQVRPCLDGSEIVVVAYGHLHSTWAFLRILHTVFKLRRDFLRRLEAQTGQGGVPPRLLDKDHINDLVLVLFDALKVSLTTLRPQRSVRKQQNNQDLCFRYGMFYEASDVCMLTMRCLTRLGNLIRLTMPQQIEDESEETMIHICGRLVGSSATDNRQHCCTHTNLDYRMVNLWCRMCLKFSTPSALEFWRLAGISSTHRISLRNLSSMPILKSECHMV